VAEGSNSDRTVVLGAGAPEPASSRLHQNALAVGTMLGEFEIVDLVGEGGFGIVYLAQDHSLQRKVALKEYMPALLASRGHDAAVSVRSERQRETFEAGLRSFVNEARMLAQFDHPALVKVYRFWEANGTAYMVMPYYSGRTLEEALKLRRDPPDEGWIRALLSPLMEALAVLHEDRVYHRDISPDNIMLLAGDRPVLLDFGAARRVISDMTHALTVILKPGYAPIEQYADVPGMKQGPWTDVYALAAVVYFMILKRKPPPAVSRLMQDGYEPIAQSEAAGRYSAQLLQGIDRCLSVRAPDRPPSMAAMREAIGVAPPAAGIAAPMAPTIVDTAMAPTVVAAPLAPTVIVAPAALPVVAAPMAATVVDSPAPPTVAESMAPTVIVTPVAPTVGAAPTPLAPVEYREPVSTGPDALDATSAVDTSPGIRHESAPAPARSSRLPFLAAGALALVAIVGGAAYVLSRPAASTAPATAPATTSAATTPAVNAPVPAPAAPPPPAAPRIVGLPAALDAAVAAADPRLGMTLEAPTAIAAGTDAKLVVHSKSDGLLYLFVWDQPTDRIYRLTADPKDGGLAIKADGSLTVTHKDTTNVAAGTWRVVSMLSEKPRDFSAAAYGRDGDLVVADRSTLEASLAANGLSGLLGTPRCAAGEPCPDHFAISVASIARQPAPPPAAKRTRGPQTAAPNAQATTPPGRKAPDSEREYMKKLDKDLDKLLGK
jgi:serine/threonine protein kinase